MPANVTQARLMVRKQVKHGLPAHGDPADDEQGVNREGAGRQKDGGDGARPGEGRQRSGHCQ
mgnify:FL=1